MLVIFIQSSIGHLPLPKIEFDLADKILHFLVFGILAIFTVRGFKNSGFSFIKENYFLFSILICVLYGASDEIHQYFVPGRDASWADWMADTLGIVVMAWLYKLKIDKKELVKEKS